MSDFLSDHIRATPGRTLLALGGAMIGRARVSVRHRAAQRTARTLNDRTLADIGLARCIFFDPSQSVDVAA